MDGAVDHISQANLNKVGKLEQRPQQVHQEEDLARAFIAAFKQADEMTRQVTDAQKKEREEDQKKRRHKPRKEDYEEKKDEIDEILDEIDKRLEKMLEIAKRYDA